MVKSKNTAVGFSLLVIILINFLVFNIALKREVDLVKIPVAKHTIYPRMKLTEEDITYIEVPSAIIKDDFLLKDEDIIGMYSDIRTTIPLNSPFYSEVLFEEKDLPDYPSILLKENQVVYNLNSDLVKLSGNSIVVGQKVDIFTTHSIRKEKPIVDMLVSDVRVVGVKDKKGLDVSHPDSNGIPYIVLLALDHDIMPLVRSCDEIATLELYAHSRVSNENEESIFNNDAKILEYINYES